ncbi:MAG: hypothetical protein ABIH38_01475 [Patescibacteria group bacterium]
MSHTIDEATHCRYGLAFLLENMVEANWEEDSEECVVIRIQDYPLRMIRYGGEPPRVYLLKSRLDPWENAKIFARLIATESQSIDDNYVRELWVHQFEAQEGEESPKYIYCYEVQFCERVFAGFAGDDFTDGGRLAKRDMDGLFAVLSQIWQTGGITTDSHWQGKWLLGKYDGLVSAKK